MTTRDRPDSSEPSTERLCSPSRLRSTRFTLLVEDGAAAGQRVTVGPELFTIGSSPRADLRLEGRGISRSHARIQVETGRCLLRDLGSTNGTLLNGVSIREAFLSPGDLITIGTSRLRFEPREQEIVVLPSDKDHFGPLYGSSLSMRQMFGFLERVAASEVTVLIQGETGTGKEMVAKALHQSSSRSKGPLVIFDCSSVQPELIASELFGHRAGSFTGAHQNRRGAFEEAAGGTIFLDEIGELPLEQQPMLLRALEAREVRPVGANIPVPVDVRVVAATHRDIGAMARQGRFREDLYYRLAVLHVHLPPLRERREDIPGLVRVLLERSTRSGAGPGISEDALEVLSAHDWPGNVRELRNVLERSAALCTGPVLTSKELLLSAASPVPAGGGLDLSNRTLEEIEREVIRQTLVRTGGNKKEAARLLGIHRTTMHEKVKKYSLDEDPE